MENYSHVHWKKHYVPDLRKNLFSVGAATKNNLKIVLDNKNIEIFNKNKFAATGTKLLNQCYKMIFKIAQTQ